MHVVFVLLLKPQTTIITHLLSLSLPSLLAVLALCHCRLWALPHLHLIPGGWSDDLCALIGCNTCIKAFRWTYFEICTCTCFNFKDSRGFHSMQSLWSHTDLCSEEPKHGCYILQKTCSWVHQVTVKATCKVWSQGLCWGFCSNQCCFIRCDLVPHLESWKPLFSFEV